MQTKKAKSLSKEVKPKNQPKIINMNNTTPKIQLKCIFCLHNQTKIPKEEKDNNEINTYYNFEGCSDIICINCIGRLLFTKDLNLIPNNSPLILTCSCNKGQIKLSIDEIMKISNKINSPPSEIICEKHNLKSLKYCLDCKKWLCQKCEESHSDLFNNHHISKEEPPNTDVCSFHPNCYLDRLCKNCNKQICHNCILEGNEHYSHNTISFEDLKKRIFENVNNMKYNNFNDYNNYLNQIDNEYKSKYDGLIEGFNEKIDKLIEIINEAKKNFIENMENKKKEKEKLLIIIKNLYQFFYSEYSKISKSVDYPVLCMYQIINCELILFDIDCPDESTVYINKILNEIKNIDNSNLFKTNYQFSLKNFKIKNSLYNHTHFVNSLCTLKDGRLVSGSEDKSIIIWNLELTKPDFIIKDNTYPVKVVKLLNDKRLISGSYKEMKIYNDTFNCINTLKDINNNVCDIINLEDGKLICSSFKELRIFPMQWDNLYNESKVIKNHSSWVTSLIKLNGKLFASGGDDKQIFIYDNNIKCVRNINFGSKITAFCNYINDIIDNENMISFYIGDDIGNIYIYNFLNDNLEIISEGQHKNKIRCIIPLFGNNYASSASDSKIIIRDNKFQPIQVLISKDNNKGINSLTQMFNGSLISGGDDFKINIFE